MIKIKNGNQNVQTHLLFYKDLLINIVWLRRGKWTISVL